MPWFGAVCQDAHRPIEAFVAKTNTAFFALNTPQTIAYTLCTSFSEARRMRQEWLEYLQRLSWNTPMILALASGAVGSLTTLAWISARDARERKRQRRDAALELALSLESYARTCRTMMHKAAWAASEPVGPMSSEASKGVSIPVFAYPDKLQWRALSRKVISELREYPATVYAARDSVEAFREFGEPIDLCGQVEYECAKAAMEALALARTTRRRHGAATWKPGAKDSAMERELSDFIANAEEKRKASLERRTESTVGRRADAQPFNQALSA
ncbi:hypothetical protein OKW43_008595 [Paraburkholderia sp. WC7.3g]|uniref:hypothetical protein n=1 Tax=Paraburkholderia sp. WC7.3g TaxID=2991070 RepID=UPI003D1DA364